MSISLLPKLSLVVLVAGLVTGPFAIAADKATSEKQLRSVLREIDKLKQTIEIKEDSKSRYIKQLKTIEGDIGKLGQKIRALGKEIVGKRSELKSLRATRLKHQRQLSRENEYLAEQVYTAFTLGQQEKAKLLFSQQDPQALQRNLVYYQYFSNARVDLINTVQVNIDKIIETEQLIQQARLQLEKNQNVFKKQENQLARDLRKRMTIIGSLDKQLKKQGGSLSRLKDEAAQLQNLIHSIEELFADIPGPEVSRKPFARLKGKLAWPLKGKLSNLFGRTRPESNLRWQGIRIEAASGSHVMAISHGRIAFADWLRGFGNLIIIDHGNSYLSLYGHNESLFKATGDWVEAGEVISSVGSSGGAQKAGLYFEIRKKNKPQNPSRWCKSSNHFTSG